MLLTTSTRVFCIFACTAFTGNGHSLDHTGKTYEEIHDVPRASAARHDDHWNGKFGAHSPLEAFAMCLLAFGIPATGSQGSRHVPRLASSAGSATGREGVPTGLARQKGILMQLTQKWEKVDTASRGGASLIQGNDLALTYDGERYLFRGISVTVARGLKLALVGPNGEGKSSLMKVLAGFQKPDEGTVERIPRLNVAYVEQDPTLPEGRKAVEFLLEPSTSMPNAGVKALFEYRVADVEAERAKQKDDAANQRLADAVEKMTETKGWDMEEEVDRLCQSLKVEHLLYRNASTLSGGERKRVALAAALVHQPELLLLDEPTNHLDMDAIQWLEGEIRGQEKLTAMIVTHDRAFLTGACEEILELDRSQIFRHRGTYDEFVEAKGLRLEHEDRLNEVYRDKLKREEVWAARGARARATKSELRLDNIKEMKENLKAADARLKKSHGQIELTTQVQRLSKVNGLRFTGASVNTPSFPPRPVIHKFDYTFSPGERIGIVGPNGIGKSTFLKALQGKLPLSKGQLEIGDTVAFGYFDQQGLPYPETQTLQSVVENAVAQRPDVPSNAVEAKAFKLLNTFRFERDQWDRRLGFLSGGEQRRVQLMEVLAKDPNILLLDEPTNDLDLATIAVLEDFLMDYKGVLLVVSHDRYFLDKVCNKHFVLDGTGKLMVWEGTVSQYMDYERDQKKEAAKAEAADKAIAKEKKQQNKIMNPGKEIKKVEKELKTLNDRRDELQKSLDEFDADQNSYEEMGQWTEEISALNDQIDEKEEYWLECAEMMNMK